MIRSPTTAGDAAVSTTSLGFLDELFERYIAQGKLAGVMTLVYRRGEVVYARGHGQIDVDRGKPMREDALFRIYSMTKPITSVAFMQLCERGLVQLDDPVHAFIPQWESLRVYQAGTYPKFTTAPCERPMTVRDLLTHQSGLTYGFTERTNVDAAYRTRGIGLEGCRTLPDMVDKLAELPLEFSPGNAWNYSVSTDVVGYLIELISDRRFDEYLREQIFEPLGMDDTAFWVRPEQVERFSAMYGPAESGDGLRLVDDPQMSPYLFPPTFLSGGGGLVSTAGDYLRFCRMLLGQGRLEGARILGRKTIELMTLNHLPGGRTIVEAAHNPVQDISRAGAGFGLGFSVAVDQVKAQIAGTPGEIAWGGAASTAFWVDPREDLAVVFMTQYLPSLVNPGTGTTCDARSAPSSTARSISACSGIILI